MSPDTVPGRCSCFEGTSSSRSLDLDKVVLMFAALVVAFDVWYVNCAQLLVLTGTVGAQGIQIEISRGRCQFCKLNMCLSAVNLSVLQAQCSRSSHDVQVRFSCSSHGVPLRALFQAQATLYYCSASFRCPALLKSLTNHFVLSSNFSLPVACVGIIA